MSNSARNGKIQWDMVIFGGSGGSATVSSQFDIVQTYDSHHTQEEPWNSILKAAAPTCHTGRFQYRPHPHPLPLYFLSFAYVLLIEKENTKVKFRNNKNVNDMAIVKGTCQESQEQEEARV